jgi:hypothetical protein
VEIGKSVPLYFTLELVGLRRDYKVCMDRKIYGVFHDI